MYFSAVSEERFLAESYNGGCRQVVNYFTMNGQFCFGRRDFDGFNDGICVRRNRAIFPQPPLEIRTRYEEWLRD